MQRGDFRSFLVLLASTLVAILLTAALPHARVNKKTGYLAAPIIRFDPTGVLSIVAKGPAELHYTLDGSFPNSTSPRFENPFTPSNERTTQELVTIPTSVQWRHPMGTQPDAVVVRACAVDEQGRAGAVATRTFVQQDHAGLPVFSLSLPPGAFFDPDTGLYVVGNAIFHAEEDFVRRYPDDQKWWKYPGNFHYRGKKFERSAQLEYFLPSAITRENGSWGVSVKLRINGNNTRGFPQHALRVLFDRPLEFPLFGAERGEDFERMVLRCSGNDQDRTFFRDALQHRLCEHMPFETSACVQSVLYVNGAYWGLHNARERLDEKELARRYLTRAKDITILADRLELYEGDPKEVKHFARFLNRCERWDAKATWFADSLNDHVDVNGFLHYMAAQIILGNVDWPDQNVKWWRYTGTPDTLAGPLDGRWRLIMGDSDMGLGMVVGADYDMFQHIDQHPASPIVRLFKVCLGSKKLEHDFALVLGSQLDGPLSESRILSVASAMRDAISAEMPQHIDRWRRPLTFARWQQNVQELLSFVHQRHARVRAEAKDRASSSSNL